MAKILKSLTMMLLLATLAPSAAWAQDTPPPSTEAEAPAEDTAPEVPAVVPLDALLKANGDIPDIVYGKPDAKIAIVEYASLTCSHCGNFHNKVLPEVKTKYLDTGKARLIFREFPLDNRALIASLLTRCAPTENAPAFVSKLFETQEDWAFAEGDPRPKLKEIGIANGLTAEKYEKCLADQALFDKLVATFSAAGRTFGINATPTIFIDGKRLSEASIEAFDKLMTETK